MYIGFLYSKIEAIDVDNDKEQEIQVYLFSFGSAGCQGLIILKIIDNNIFEIPLPMHNVYDENHLGVNAELNFADNFEAVITAPDYFKTLNTKLDDIDESLKQELYTNGVPNIGHI